ncbi:MAG: hypothetical protein HQ559_07855 [Lentisphaerae bacterium]|nr:hypothetical protein [Lentisphaerota bacterium]
MNNAFIKGRRRAAGFTLIDIMLVVAIFGVMACFAVVSMRRVRARHSLDDAVSVVVAELRAARTYARSGSRPVLVAIDPVGKTLTVRIDRDGNGSFTANEQSVVRIGRSPAVSVSVNTTNGVFSAAGSFSCAQSFWKTRVSVPDLGVEYVYVFAAGQIERSEESL